MDKTPASEGFVTIPATLIHTATVIFIHGYTQSNLTWKALVAESLAPSLPHVEWILPQATKHITTFYAEEPVPSWFDIAALPPHPDEYDEGAIIKSIKAIQDLIQSQVDAGLDSRHVILVGFSQGAALSMMASLTTKHQLGGVVSLSGWIPPRARSMLNSTHKFPILWCHGIADIKIPLTMARDGLDFLHELLDDASKPSQLQHFQYEDLEHETNAQELQDVALWLQTVLSQSGAPS